ncbi:PEP-CTERM sorting domain-containing protein [Roseateles asaccharophilus]|uniref:Ice-binding protein C-terminal domain-containing protein n=1 Tax=Roseateles asaccharophilus TaxID=582607 RepID=A0ABU2A420_9BURK|nr:PEP-CTERM sorting domain-containing protein [Roseateles asaccharophilus]MDR7331840.1 hypothetical protein [Roseateles asaccharophilus]
MKKLAFAATLLPTFASAAGLLGTTVSVNYHLDSLSTLDSVLVGAGAELSCPGTAQLCSALTVPAQTVDIGDNSIRYFYVGAGTDFTDTPVNRFSFQSLYGGDVAITGVDLATNIAGLTASRLTFTSHGVQVDMRDLSVGSEAFFELSLQTAPVPEPASAALLLGGLALLAARRRRRR